MKKSLIISLGFFLLLGIISVTGFLWWRSAIQAPMSSEENVRFVIPKGRSAQSIADELKAENLIKSPLAFKFYVQLTGKSSSIKAGEFTLSKNLTLFELIDRLAKGPDLVWVTIPEGLRREEIPDRFISSLGLDDQMATDFRKSYIDASARMEGYLFPDTYLVPKDLTGDSAAKMMRQTFDNKIKELKIKDLNEVVIIASLIEREAKSIEERPIIAGVIKNRLMDGMPLQIDATVQYALANDRCSWDSKCNWWVPPLRQELETPSEYNTYKVTGLPVAPISNPGFSSLQAATEPAETEFYYYIHDKEGNIHFARTIEEHNQNVSKYLR